MTPSHPLPSEPDLPERVVVGANGAYWRDYGDSYSMCPVSTDNDPVVPMAIYVRDYTDPILDTTNPAVPSEPDLAALREALDSIKATVVRESWPSGWEPVPLEEVAAALADNPEPRRDGLREALWGLHEQGHEPDGDWCSADHVSWPCPTADLLYRMLGPSTPVRVECRLLLDDGTVCNLPIGHKPCSYDGGHHDFSGQTWCRLCREERAALAAADDRP